MTIDLILGTAGHIDHGKTTLVQALTGRNTDRLPEELRRGISIELGFAELNLGEYRLGIVDVPGHERFVRNMLAGATGIDLVMLVVAADDSVNQQTREHLEILRMLDVPAGVVALTKCDLAAEERLSAVEQEVRRAVQGTFLATAPIVRVAAPHGIGLPELRQALADQAHVAAETRGEASAPFRMSIDRVFSLAGQGTVVTGSVASGRVAVGESLMVEPPGVRVRVRGLHRHDCPVQEVHRGQRAAINVAGAALEAISRGHEMATPGYLAPSKILTGSIMLLEDVPCSLKTRDRVRLHVGTAAVSATVRLLDRDRLEPGGRGLAQLFLSESVAATWNQPFVLRLESPVRTIGGGRVLDPTAEKLKANDAQALAELARIASSDARERAAAAIYLAGLRPWQLADLARLAGLAQAEEICAALVAQGDVREVKLSPNRALRVHRLVLNRVGERICAQLARLHAKEPLSAQFDVARVMAAASYLEPEVMRVALADLAQSGRVWLSGEKVRLAEHGPKLSQNEERLMLRIVEDIRAAGVEAPFVGEYEAKTTHLRGAVRRLFEIGAARGDLVCVSSEYYLHAEIERHVREILARQMPGGKTAALSEIRTWLGTTRKYAVPLAEYLDRQGFTRRIGDVRVLVDSPRERE